MKYKVLQDGKFMEGWGKGDIIEMDAAAAKGPLEEGFIVLANAAEVKTEIVEKEEKKPEVKEPKTKADMVKEMFYCDLCNKSHKISSKPGQKCLAKLNNPKTQKDLAERALKDFKGVLNKAGVEFWLEGGTLLGAYRDKDFCEDDYDDIDLSCWGHNKGKIERIKVWASRYGFDLYHEWNDEGLAYQVSFERDGNKIDLFFREVHDDYVWGALYKGEDVATYELFPGRFFTEGLKKIKFKGVDFNIPKRTEEYLTYKYGAWNVPVHRSEYSCYKAISNVDALPWKK